MTPQQAMWRIRRAVSSDAERLTRDEAVTIVQAALEENRRFMGGHSKTENYALELIRDRISQGDSMWMLGTLADAFLVYLQNGGTAHPPPEE